MTIARVKTRTKASAPHPCECGCGTQTQYRFVRGHASRRPEIRKQYAKNLSALNGSIDIRIANSHARQRKAWQRNPSTKSPTALIVAWAAGVYEGEGSCSAYKQTVNAVRLGVTVSQKDPEIVWRLREYFGGSVSTVRGPIGQTIYRWDITSVRAHGFLMTIWGFMSSRRRGQIAKALALYLAAPTNVPHPHQNGAKS